MPRKILLLQLAGIGYNFLKQNIGGENLYHLKVKPIQGLFPALTCVVQATMRTACLPQEHGIVGNGFFFKEQWKPLFWEQSSRLIQKPFIWEKFRSRGARVGQLFIQQSLGPGSDLLLSPAPIHKHHGGMILDCFSKPQNLYPRLRQKLGCNFPLHHYWGPLASLKSSQWISKAVRLIMEEEKPDFLYSYLPHLDYALQKYGPKSPLSQKAGQDLLALLKELLSAASRAGYYSIIFGDYPILQTEGVIFPNKFLQNAGFFQPRVVQGRDYPNFYTSSAFCLVDHQIAHLYLFELSKEREITKNILENLKGVELVLDKAAQAELGIAHPRSGDLLLVAKPGYWFDYRWWDKKKQAPDFAGHVDIHNKPGYDPCELFWGWPPTSVSQNPWRIKGTHGRVDESEPVFYASDFALPQEPATLLDLSKNIAQILMDE